MEKLLETGYTLQKKQYIINCKKNINCHKWNKVNSLPSGLSGKAISRPTSSAPLSNGLNLGEESVKAAALEAGGGARTGTGDVRAAGETSPLNPAGLKWII